MAAETIGDRARHRAAELGAVHRYTFASRPHTVQNIPLREPAAHLYHTPSIPDRLSILPVGRHRASAEKLSYSDKKGLKRDATYTGSHHLPSEPEAKAIARLRAVPTQPASPVVERTITTSTGATPKAKHRAESEEPVNPVVTTQDKPTLRSLPTPRIRPAAPGFDRTTPVPPTSQTHLSELKIRPAAPDLALAKLPDTPNTTPLGPKRVPFAALREEIPDFETSVPVLEQAEFDYPQQPPIEPSTFVSPLEPVTASIQSPVIARAVVRLPAPDPELATPAVPTEPEPVSPTEAPPLPTESSDTDPTRARRLASAGFSSSSEPEETQSPLRSSTGEHLHRKPKKRKRRIPRAVMGATLAIALAGGLVGGMAIWKKHYPSQPGQKSVELVISDIPKPLIPESHPTAISITEPDIISQQDRNGWGHSANKTQATLHRNYSLMGTTNIVKDIAASDFPGDLDDAGPGTQMDTPTANAILQIDRLQQPLGSDASAAERDAARIIALLNSLGPMETEALVKQYDPQIKALIADLTTILTPNQEVNQDVSSATPASASESHTVTTKTKATTIFTGLAQRATSVFRSDDPMTKARKASAALARDRQRRLRQPSFA